MSNLTPWQTSDVPVIETNFYHAVIKLQNDPFHPQAKGTTIGYVNFFLGNVFKYISHLFKKIYKRLVR